MKQDLVRWYDNNINHPQRSLKQFAGDFYFVSDLTSSCSSTTHSFIPSWG
ncbi:hypothetical protein HUN01_00335 (plasmid) [Nostoc edaphicum CCNP1411]|uniref:Uncharacterized protein n=1 Tax=Nostoc edaphicum CCNP1411 TaxID=1472755 RepID=A0A7D7Q8Y6_9NOSO|nr:hypothetical protein [Nostoc edaphicum]QMS86115.1 hypothetical protein HUN01_00335 [Nostoc edaphicum CCNP1411]